MTIKNSGFPALLLLFSAIAYGQDPGFDAKSAIVKTVYDKLTASSGVNKIPPQVVMTPGKPLTDGKPAPGKLAYYQKGGTVTVSEFVYDECKQLAGTEDRVPDCLSVLLGHELAHFYLDHSWAADVTPLLGGVRRDAGLPDKPTRQQQDVVRRYQEAQADHYAGVYGYQAGYKPADYGAALFDKIYADFKLMPRSTPDYPELKERKEILEGSYRYLTQQLYPAFEAGLQLFVLGKYERAANCFDFISETFVSREILNNAAAAYILAAMEADPKLSGGYLYPVNLDLETRLNPSHVQHKAVEDRLEMAARRLRIALTLDPLYPQAIVNSAIVAILRATPEDPQAQQQAKTEVDAAAKIGAPYTAQVQVLRAILDARSGHQQLAEQILNRMPKDPLAAMNLRVLKGEKLDGQQAPIMTSATSGEKISGKDLATIESFGAGQDPVMLYSPQTQRELPVQLGVNITPQFRAYYLTSGDSPEVTLVTTPAGYKDALLGKYRVGSNIKDLIAERPKALARRYATPQGVYYVFADPAVLVFTSPAGRVVNWTLFKTTGAVAEGGK